MRTPTFRRALLVLLVVALMLVGLTVPAHAGADGVPGADPSLYAPPFPLGFPLEGSHGFSDTFGAIRDGGSRLHQGTDISAPKATPVLAAAAGVVSRVDVGEKAGLYVEIRHAGGWRTLYLHLNNDEPPPPPVVESVCEVVPVEDEAVDGTATEDTATEDTATEDPSVEDVVVDDAAIEGEICPEEPLTWGIPPEIFVGAEVAAGDVIGFVGTSGNASSTAPHLHFEVRMPDGTSVNPYPLLTGRTSPSTLYVLPDVTDEPITTSIEVVGHVDLTGGFTADVWVHSGIAYLGTLGRGEACPATGVRRYDVTDPSEPVEMEAISEDYPGTSTEAVWAGRVETDRFSGDLAVIAHQLCDPGDREAFRGFALYDVTDSSLPVLLGTYGTGPGTLGVVGFDVWIEQDRILVVAAAPNSFLDHPDALGDVRIVDVTDPANPVDVADWDFRRDAQVKVGDAVLDDADPRDFGSDALLALRDPVLDDADPRNFRVQGITLDQAGERAFVAHWDAGVVVLDLSNPSQPEAVGRIASIGRQEGESSSTVFDPESGILVISHWDLDPLGDEVGTGSWGISAVFDARGRNGPSLASIYAIEDALPDADGRLALGGMYTAFEAVMAGHYLYAIWISGGLRVVDLSDPTELIEVASFVPPTRVDPQRHFASPNGNIAMPLAWSVHVVDELIYVSDLNTGLWILRLPEPRIGTD